MVSKGGDPLFIFFRISAGLCVYNCWDNPTGHYMKLIKSWQEELNLRLKNMTIEELEDFEQDLHERVGEEPLYSQRIDIYEEMARRLRRIVRENPEEKSYLDYVTRKLVFHLIHYGTYLKMEYEKDDYLAINCLKKALNIDRKNPIAAYRLGFLSYKHRDYNEALNNFQKALDHDQYYEDKDFRLNETQIVNAHLYLTNSALYIAKYTYERMNKLPYVSQQDLPHYELSSLYESLSKNEQYLEKNAFYKMTEKETITCSKAICDELTTDEPRNTLVLYFNDRTIQLVYNDNLVELGQNHGDILRYLLTKSSEETPATRITLQNYFPNSIAKGEVNKNTFIQAVNRLKTKLRSCDIPPIINTSNHSGETAYYFDKTLPYIVMFRVDQEIEYLS